MKNLFVKKWPFVLGITMAVSLHSAFTVVQANENDYVTGVSTTKKKKKGWKGFTHKTKKETLKAWKGTKNKLKHTKPKKSDQNSNFVSSPHQDQHPTAQQGTQSVPQATQIQYAPQSTPISQRPVQNSYPPPKQQQPNQQRHCRPLLPPPPPLTPPPGFEQPNPPSQQASAYEQDAERRVPPLPPRDYNLGQETDYPEQDPPTLPDEMQRPNENSDKYNDLAYQMKTLKGFTEFMNIDSSQVHEYLNDYLEFYAAWYIVYSMAEKQGKTVKTNSGESELFSIYDTSDRVALRKILDDQSTHQHFKELLEQHGSVFSSEDSYNGEEQQIIGQIVDYCFYYNDYQE